jgi:hypothetical protein
MVYKKNDNCKMENSSEIVANRDDEISKTKKKKKSQNEGFRRASFENKSDSLKSVLFWNHWT